MNSGSSDIPLFLSVVLSEINFTFTLTLQDFHDSINISKMEFITYFYSS